MQKHAVELAPTLYVASVQLVLQDITFFLLAQRLVTLNVSNVKIVFKGVSIMQGGVMGPRIGFVSIAKHVLQLLMASSITHLSSVQIFLIQYVSLAFKHAQAINIWSRYA